MFETGKIYACQYMNSKNDPSPLVLIFNANIEYIEGINLNYLSDYEKKVVSNFIMRYNVMFQNISISGVLLYKVLKRDIYPIIRKSYRKYFYAYIRGFLVSNGFKENTEAPIPQERVMYTNNPFIKYLNTILQPNVRTFEKEEIKSKQKIVDRVFGAVKEKLTNVRKWWEVNI